PASRGQAHACTFNSDRTTRRQKLDRQERVRAVSDRLRLRRSRQRRSDQGELWLDHLCLFHDDDHVSATWQEETAIYHCWAEDKTYSLDQVESALGSASHVASGNSRPVPKAALPAPP